MLHPVVAHATTGDVSDGLLTSKQVAERFKVNRTTVLRWAKAGRLPSVRTPGGAFRFRPSDVEEFLRFEAEAASA